MADAHYSESPFLAFLGTVLEQWRDGYVRVGLMLRPHHLNRAGVVHGGVLAALLDHAGGFCGLFTPEPGPRRGGVTLSLTTNYLAQSSQGALVATGERVAGGKRIFHSRMEVRGADAVVLATGTGVYRYRGVAG